MVSVPVRLFKAARRERIRFHHVDKAVEEPPAGLPWEDDSEEAPPSRKEGAAGIHAVPTQRAELYARPQPVAPPEQVARVRSRPVEEGGETAVPREEILKGYEIEKDRYVVVEPSELAALRPRTSTELEIAEFVRLNEIDPIYFDASYYVAPEPGGEKAYAVLFRALQETGYAAVGSLAMHGREHATVIRPGKRGLILHTIFFANEVRSGEEYSADSEAVAPKELELASLFVRTLAAPFDPAKLKDTFEERVRALIDRRADVTVSAGVHPKEEHKAPAADIMDALRRSLEAARKPAGREARSPHRPATTRSRPRKR
jgi:DNA end-binding protein Ku